RTPADTGPAGPLGFQVEFNGEPLARYLVPLAAAPGEVVELHLRDLPTPPAEDSPEGGLLRVRCVDAAGNVGPASEWRVTRSRRTPVPLPQFSPAETATASTASERAPRLGDVAVSFLDTLDKVHPERGEVVPTAPANYRLQNHLWDARTRTLTLRGSRKELVGWQLLLEGGELTEPPRLELEGLTADGGDVRVDWWRGVLVADGTAWWPDPLLPFDTAAPASRGATRAASDGGRDGGATRRTGAGTGCGANCRFPPRLVPGSIGGACACGAATARWRCGCGWRSGPGSCPTG
ncbi:MAG: hypothetical protein ACKOJF_05345, partial [Planctomycetaceae bacterium]